MEPSFIGGVELQERIAVEPKRGSQPNNALPVSPTAVHGTDGIRGFRTSSV